MEETVNMNRHTCHISHCEIKWLIWKPIPIRFFKSHRIFTPSYNTFYEEINIHHFVCVYHKAFWLFWGSFKVIFVKISQNFIKTSLKNLSYLTDFRPQLMACMKRINLERDLSMHCTSILFQLLTLLLSTFKPCHEKTCLWHIRTTKVQISLHIGAPLLFTAWHTCDSSLFRRDLPIFCTFLIKSPYQNFRISFYIIHLPIWNFRSPYQNLRISFFV